MNEEDYPWKYIKHSKPKIGKLCAYEDHEGNRFIGQRIYQDKIAANDLYESEYPSLANNGKVCRWFYLDKIQFSTFDIFYIFRLIDGGSFNSASFIGEVYSLQEYENQVKTDEV